MNKLYWDEFGVDLLGSNFVSAGSVISSHLEAMTNKASVQGFSQIKNGSIGRTLIAARLGGIVESRIRRTGRLVESEDGASSTRCVGLDVNALYPSTICLYSCMYGEPTFYSNVDESGILKATSNVNPYGQEYKVVNMTKYEVANRFGEKVLSMYSNHSNSRRSLMPRYYPDAVIFSVGADGNVVITVVQHDGYNHVKESGRHHKTCARHTEENDMEHSPFYRATLAAAERNKETCHKLFTEWYSLRFISSTECAFHSSYQLHDGRRFANIADAFANIRREKPELCLSADHKPTLWLDDVMTRGRREESSNLAGFVVFK